MQQRCMAFVAPWHKSTNSVERRSWDAPGKPEVGLLRRLFGVALSMGYAARRFLTWSESMEDVKILQIMPAEGWVAVYDGGDEGEMEEPLACFALVQVDYKNGDGIQTEVRGMAPDEKVMGFVEDATNFVTVRRAEEAEAEDEEDGEAVE